MLLVGSRALAHWYPDSGRVPGDWDLWLAADALDGWLARLGERPGAPTLLDAGIARRLRIGGETLTVTPYAPESAAALFVAANAGSPEITSPAGPVRVARPTTLLLVKRSHLFAPAKWNRHIADFHFLKRRVDESAVTAAERAAYDQRVAENARRDRLGEHEGSMKVPNEVFFSYFKYADIRVYEHDALHEATCYHGEPLYRTLKDDRSRALVPRANFQRLPHEEKVRLVREEAFALALERVLIPANELDIPWNPHHAYLHALRRICTDITRGWFRDFAIEHHPEIAVLDVDFAGRFFAAVASGAVKRRLPERLDDATRARLREQLDRVRRREAIAEGVATQGRVATDAGAAAGAAVDDGAATSVRT